jgi:hypothetical protein
MSISLGRVFAPQNPQSLGYALSLLSLWLERFVMMFGISISLNPAIIATTYIPSGLSPSARKENATPDFKAKYENIAAAIDITIRELPIRQLVT